MHRAYLAACLFLLTTSPRTNAGPAPPSGRPATQPAALTYTPEGVEKAIQRGAKYVWSRQNTDGTWGRVEGRRATTAWVAFALMRSAWVNPQDPRLAKALACLETKQRETSPRLTGMQCLAWGEADRQMRSKFRKRIQSDAAKAFAWLRGKESGLSASDQAGTRVPDEDHYFAMEGLLTAASIHLEIPRQIWPDALAFWQRSQNADGGWPAAAGGKSDLLATARAMRVVLAAHERAHAEDFAAIGKDTRLASVERAQQWLDKQFAGQPPGQIHRRLSEPALWYALAQAAWPTGRWRLARRDLYRLGATGLLGRQRPDGSWPGADPLAATCGAMLFLAHGRRPVLLTKLKHNGDWNNRPHAMGSLVSWLSVRMCCAPGGFEWELQDIAEPLKQWRQGQLLLITGSVPPPLARQHIDRLRTFVQRGGTIVTCGEGEGQAFAGGMRRLARRLFPQYPLLEVPQDHPMRTRRVYYDLPGKPKLHLATNGVRALMIHIEGDLPVAWQMRKWTSRRYAFDVMVNVLQYTRERPWSGNWCRTQTPWPAPPAGPASRQVALARLKHAGNWDPEPLAYERFSRMLQAQTGVGLNVFSPVAVTDLSKSKAPIATLTGTGTLTLSAAEKAAIKQYVTGGGTLVIDAAGGNRDFAKSTEGVLREIFGIFAVRQLASTAPPYRLTGHDIKGVRYRRITRRRLGENSTGNLKGVGVDGGKRLGVLYSGEDLTAGLLGATAWGIDGYSPKSAYEIMRNVVLSTMRENLPERKPDSKPEARE